MLILQLISFSQKDDFVVVGELFLTTFWNLCRPAEKGVLAGTLQDGPADLQPLRGATGSKRRELTKLWPHGPISSMATSLDQNDQFVEGLHVCCSHAWLASTATGAVRVATAFELH